MSETMQNKELFKVRLPFTCLSLRITTQDVITCLVGGIISTALFICYRQQLELAMAIILLVTLPVIAGMFLFICGLRYSSFASKRIGTALGGLYEKYKIEVMKHAFNDVTFAKSAIISSAILMLICYFLVASVPQSAGVILPVCAFMCGAATSKLFAMSAYIISTIRGIEKIIRRAEANAGEQND